MWRIHLVEDCLKESLFLARFFHAMGCVVDVAMTASDALFRWDNFRGTEFAHDVVVLDLLLPDAPGLNVLRAMRRCCDETPIIVVSHCTDPEERLAALRAGADDYVMKPFLPEELFERIRSVVDRVSGRIPGATWRLQFNRRDRAFYLDGRRVDLKPRALAVLRCLFEKPFVVLSREEILAHVWQTNSDVESNRVDAQIKFIRKKLAGFTSPEEARLMLETARAMGYRLNPDGHAAS